MTTKNAYDALRTILTNFATIAGNLEALEKEVGVKEVRNFSTQLRNANKRVSDLNQAIKAGGLGFDLDVILGLYGRISDFYKAFNLYFEKRGVATFGKNFDKNPTDLMGTISSIPLKIEVLKNEDVSPPLRRILEANWSIDRIVTAFEKLRSKYAKESSFGKDIKESPFGRASVSAPPQTEELDLSRPPGLPLPSIDGSSSSSPSVDMMMMLGDYASQEVPSSRPRPSWSPASASSERSPPAKQQIDEYLASIVDEGSGDRTPSYRGSPESSQPAGSPTIISVSSSPEVAKAVAEASEADQRNRLTVEIMQLLSRAFTMASNEQLEKIAEIMRAARDS